MRALAVLVATAAILGAAACSSSGKTATPSAPTTTAASTVGVATFAGPGPFGVGYTTLHLAGGRRVVVWYPAIPGLTQGAKQESIDVASMLSPALQAKVPAADRVLYPVKAFQDVTAADSVGGSPLVIFSHGYAGFPEQSVSITTHLASWGFVVAAPDHVERSLDGLLGTAAVGVPKQTDVQVLQATIKLVLAASNQPGVLHGLVDPNRIVAAGHSAGAGAAYELASVDPQIKAWISYAVGFGGQLGPAPAPPKKPGMVMLGTTDGIIPPAQSVKVYQRMNSPKYLAKFAGAGHLVFSDICLIGAGKGGLVNIAKALNLPIPASLFKLGSDGCARPHPPVANAFPAINQLTVAFFRYALGIDKQPVGLTTAAVAGLGAPVVVIHG
jgi:dienelactone hydrolase